MYKNDQGFSIVEALLVLVLIVLLASGGWFVWHKKQQNKEHTATGTSKQQKTTAPKATIPSGYQTYTSTEAGFSLAYPKEWGSMATPDRPDLDYTATTNELNNQTGMGTSYLQGRFGLSVKPKTGFQLVAQKYGATVSPSLNKDGSYSWKVSAVNPADTKEKMGDTYQVTSYKNAAGLVLYDFSSADEGSTTARWVFATKDSFVTVSLPAVYRPQMAAVSSNDMGLYRNLAKTIADTITRQ